MLVRPSPRVTNALVLATIPLTIWGVCFSEGNPLAYVGFAVAFYAPIIVVVHFIDMLHAVLSGIATRDKWLAYRRYAYLILGLAVALISLAILTTVAGKH